MLLWVATPAPVLRKYLDTSKPEKQQNIHYHCDSMLIDVNLLHLLDLVVGNITKMGREKHIPSQ